LAPSAFLASAAGSSDLVNRILPPRLRSCGDAVSEEAISRWSLGLSEDPPSGQVSHQQKMWDTPRVSATYETLLEDASDSSAWACLLAAASKESGAWLSALPLSSLGLQMDNETLRIAAGLRLGSAICYPHQCSHCDAEADRLATHSLSWQ